MAAMFADDLKRILCFRDQYELTEREACLHRDDKTWNPALAVRVPSGYFERMKTMIERISEGLLAGVRTA